MKALIIDDDKLNCRLIKSLVSKYCPDVTILGESECVENALELIACHKPQLLLLDIELHDKTAFEILKVTSDYSHEVVLITAYLKYAPESYNYPISAYLLKPIQVSDLVNAIAKCRKNIAAKSVENKAILELQAPKFIAVPNNEQVDLIDVNTIIRLESDNNYTTIYTDKGKQIVSAKPIKEYEKRLPIAIFLRVHNSHIVNLKCIRSYLRTKNGSLIMNDGSVVPISASRKKELTDRIII